MDDFPVGATATAPPIPAEAEPALPWLALASLPRFSPRQRQALLDHTAAATDLLTMTPATLKAMGLRAETIAAVRAWQTSDHDHPLWQRLTRILADCRDHGVGVVSWGDAAYPEALRHIHQPPLVLYTLGDPALLGRDQIGVVGSRNATPAGLDHARRFATELSQRGLMVTSGLALGIDGAAHAGALDADQPTVAVIGCGLDRLYPARHRALAQRIARHGLIVSEYPPGTPARAPHFPQRNRIISGLSRGILVVEAGLNSGSLITARLALEQGREVFAIPGSIHSPVARGCHQLIKQGARLVETVDDILEELGTWWTLQPKGDSPAPAGPDLTGLAAREIAVLEALGYDPLSTDTLVQSTGLPADQLMQSLLLLELEGLVCPTPGGFVRKA